MDPAAYKQAHEEFVSNHNGSTILDLIYCFMILPPLLVVLCVAQGRAPPVYWRDLVVVALPQLCCLTLFAESWLAGLVLYIIAGAALVSQGSPLVESPAHVTSPTSQRGHVEGTIAGPGPSAPLTAAGTVGTATVPVRRVQCLSYYKGSNMLLTCIAILAVDFPVFPRRFAKTETFGVSLMDIGIGTFICASAFTSRYARGDSGTASRGAGGGLFMFGYHVSLSALQKCVVLFLGIGRAIAVRVVNYHSHTSEYGTEWNFFVTLYLLWVLADVVHAWCSRLGVFLLGLLLPLGYQYVLVHSELTEYILNASRSNFFSSNREGILSLIGCLSLFLLCESLSYVIFFRTNSRQTDSDENGKGKPELRQIRVQWFSRMLTVTGLLLALWSLSDTYQSTSRRLFNFAFVMLCLFVATLGITLLLAVDLICEPYGCSDVELLQRLNDHQLSTFFFANILTGVVNMSVHTVYQSTPTSMCILGAYVSLVQGFAWVIDINAVLEYLKKFFLRR